jgi:hypothetical protein
MADVLRFTDVKDWKPSADVILHEINAHFRLVFCVHLLDSLGDLLI